MKEDNEKKRSLFNKIKKYIPNTITAGRIGMAMGFIGSFLKGNMSSAVTLFAGASISDAIDGHLARKWKVESKFGKYLDPLADKLLVGSALLLYGTINPMMYITLLGELSIAGVNILSLIKNKKVDVNKAGKMKTVLLMTTVSLALLSTLFYNVTFNKLITFLTMINIPFQGSTFAGYVEQLFKVNKDECNNNNKNINEINNNNELENTKSKTKNKELDRKSKIEKLKEEREKLIGNNIEYEEQKVKFKGNVKKK